jgi:cytochrome P450
VFPDGDRFGIDRRPAVTLTFGFGVHYCLGVHLARAQLEVALQVLVQCLPRLRFDGDGSDVRIGGSFIQLLRAPNKLPVRFDLRVRRHFAANAAAACMVSMYSLAATIWPSTTLKKKQ